MAADHDMVGSGEPMEEVDADFGDALAINARLKELLAGGVTDPAAAEEVMRLAAAMQAQQGGQGASAGGRGPPRGQNRGGARGERQRRGRGASGGRQYPETGLPPASVHRAPMQGPEHDDVEYDGDLGYGDDEFEFARATASRSRESRSRGGTRGGGGSKSVTASASGAAASRRNYTFTEEHLNQIGRANLRLMHSLSNINQGRGVMRTRERRVKIQSSAAINRRRRGRAIMNDNAAFLKRLQNVKASSSLSRVNMRKDAKKQKKLAAQMRTVGKKSAPKPKPKPRTRRRRGVPPRRPKAKPSDLDARANAPGFNF